MSDTLPQSFKFEPQNQPLRRPGVYLIRNIVSGKSYVGISKNIARRLTEHARGRGFAPILAKAVKKYGADQFIAEPLFYSLDGTDCLLEIETALIAEYNCIDHGYNVQAASKSYGPYGPAFALAVKQAHAKPETKERMRQVLQRLAADPDFCSRRDERIRALAKDPEVRAKSTASLRATLATPESKALRSKISKAKTPEEISARTEKMRATMATQEFKEKRSRASREVQSRAGMRERISEANRKTMSTPEFKAKRSAISRAMQTPELIARKAEITRAAFARPEVKARQRAALVGRRWINNGVIEQRVHITDHLSNGWVLGRLWTPPHKKI